MAHTIAGAAGSMAARMDTTHHVAAGSAVYVGETKVADIIKVVIVHADTSPSTPARGAADSALKAALRQEMTIYSTSAPGADAGSQFNNVIGHIDGTYDADAPVKITLSPRTGVATVLPPVQLMVQGRPQPIPVY
jgi:hypothetical protein